MEALLKVNDISMVFGGLRAVSNFSMEIKAGELIGLIGPNGAGKTTAFNMITGVYTPTEGEIMFNGTRTSGKKSYQVTQLGMARTFQNIRLFSELSVIDNVKIAYNMHVKYTLGEAIARVGRYFSEEDEITKKALELLKIFKLEDKAYETAKNLPYGEQRRLEIARALATEPKLLLLDEAKICASAGSACSAGAVEPSHVLLALGLTPAQAKSTLRLTLDAANTAEEIDTAAAVITACVQRLRDGVR